MEALSYRNAAKGKGICRRQSRRSKRSEYLEVEFSRFLQELLEGADLQNQLSVDLLLQGAFKKVDVRTESAGAVGLIDGGAAGAPPQPIPDAREACELRIPLEGVGERQREMQRCRDAERDAEREARWAMGKDRVQRSRALTPERYAKVRL